MTFFRRNLGKIAVSGIFSLTVMNGAQAATVNMRWNGSGCTKADEHSESASDRFIAKKDMEGNFEVKRGPTVRMSESRKNCTVLLVSEGAKEQIALEKIFVTGQRPNAVVQKHDLSFDLSMQGQAQTKTITVPVTASKEPKYEVEKTLAESELQWSPCDRGLMINAKQRLEAKDPATASIESVTYSLRTKPCTK